MRTTTRITCRTIAAIGLLSTAALLLPATVGGCASDDSKDRPSSLKGDSSQKNTYGQDVERNREHARGQYVPRLPGNGGQ